MRVKGRWLLLVATLALAAGLYGWRAFNAPEARQERAMARDVVRVVPEDVRIKVEVLNATTTRGLARQATFYLRDAGFDVVASGNSSERPDSTVVLVRGDRMDWAALATKALGGARIELRPDSSRYLDLTILLGPTWRPPPEAFHP